MLGAMFRQPSPVTLSPVAQMRQYPNKIKAINIRSLLPWIRPYWHLLVAGIVCIVLASASVLGLGQLFRLVIDSGIGESSPLVLMQGVMGMMAVVIVLALASFGRVVLLSAMAEHVLADIRSQIILRLLNATMTWLETQKSGDLISRLTSDASVIQTVINTALPTALRNAVLLGGGLVLMILSSWKLCLVMLGVTPLILAILYYIGPKLRQTSRALQTAIGVMGAQLSESIYAVREIQAFANETQQHTYFNVSNHEIVKKSWRFLLYRGAFTAMIMLVIFSSVAVLLWIGGQEVIEQNLTPGALTAFVFYALLVAGSVGALSEIYGDLQRAAAAWQRLVEMLSAPMVSMPETVTRPVPINPNVITLDKVKFSYPTRPEQAIFEIDSLDIPLRQQIAIVGHSGAGKTTFFDLLLRFYEVQQGSIKMDGCDIAQFDLADYRRLFALVPQNPSLFSTTIAENIKLYRDVSDEDIKHAAHIAGADSFIQVLPDQYDTILGERGLRLSGGQMQRLAIARALLQGSKILLLDEATAHLDAETEWQFKQQLKQLKQEMTVFVIAHRLSTIQDSDLIIVLDRGKVAGHGSHDFLMTSCSVYRQLIEAQDKRESSYAI